MKTIVSLLMLIGLVSVDSRAASKHFECKIFETSEFLTGATIILNKSLFGGISSADLKLYRINPKKNSIANLQGPLKTADENSYDKNVYLEGRTNCYPWPICDEYYLHFKGYNQPMNFSDLPSEIDFALETLSGPAVDRRHDISLLVCSETKN